MTRMGQSLESLPTMGPLGLIAGEGVFPLLVARGARAAGRKVVCAAFAVKNMYFVRIDSKVDRFRSWPAATRR